jgi:predicted O-methyltransferase YrrM
MNRDDAEFEQLIEEQCRLHEGLSAIQNAREFSHFLRFCQRYGPLETYLEIGVAWGGSARILWEHVGFQRGLLMDDNGVGPRLEDLPNLAPLLPICRCYNGDSHQPAAAAFLQRELADRRLSLVFIDADHSLEGVTADFELVKPHLQPNTLIAFHDICGSCGQGTGVQSFWKAREQRGLFAVAEYTHSQALGIGIAIPATASLPNHPYGPKADAGPSPAHSFWQYSLKKYPHWFPGSGPVLEVKSPQAASASCYFPPQIDYLTAGPRAAAGIQVVSPLEHLRLPRRFHTVLGEGALASTHHWPRALDRLVEHVEQPDGGLFLTWYYDGTRCSPSPLAVAAELESKGIYVHELRLQPTGPGSGPQGQIHIAGFHRKSIAPGESHFLSAWAPSYHQGNGGAPWSGA